MSKVLIQDIATRLYSGEWGEVCIDSRLVKKGDVFVALPGNRCHGNDFIKEVLAQGAVCVVADAGVKHPQHELVMAVKKPDQFLWDLSIKVKSLSRARRVAITGSNGKTTTKDMLACILGDYPSILKTKGNLNNQLGAPLTLCRLKHYHHTAVIEIGTSFPGEIEKLTRLVQPEISVITSINRAHLSGFKSLSAIAVEKSAIFRDAPEAKCFLRSEDLKHRAVRQAIKGRDYEFFDIEEHQDEPSEYTSHNGCIHWDFKGTEFVIATPAQHNIDNAQAAISVGLALGQSLDNMKVQLAKWRAPDHRMCLLNWKKRKILDDCYNANPASVMAALETAVGLRRNEQQRIFVLLGDMKEMGRRSKSLHRDIGMEMARMGIDALFTLGDYAKETLYSFVRSGGQSFLHCQSTEEMVQMIKDYSRPHDIILVKGSRSMHLEQVISALEETAPSRKQLTC
jgi:UDP-N-acetylmuramoyl-tripeptide--D-alanyl-D-alanine ligase